LGLALEVALLFDEFEFFLPLFPAFEFGEPAVLGVGAVGLRELVALLGVGLGVGRCVLGGRGVGSGERGGSWFRGCWWWGCGNWFRGWGGLAAGTGWGSGFCCGGFLEGEEVWFRGWGGFWGGFAGSGLFARGWGGGFWGSGRRGERDDDFRGGGGGFFAGGLFRGWGGFRRRRGENCLGGGGGLFGGGFLGGGLFGWRLGRRFGSGGGGFFDGRFFGGGAFDGCGGQRHGVRIGIGHERKDGRAEGGTRDQGSS